MADNSDLSTRYTRDVFIREAESMLGVIRSCQELEDARRALYHHVSDLYFDRLSETGKLSSTQRIRLRDCTAAFRSMLLPRSARVAGFDLVQALWDVSRGIARPDLEPGFWAEMIHMVRGLSGHSPITPIEEDDIFEELTGREAAQARSNELDALWSRVERYFSRYPDGLSDAARARRDARRAHVLQVLGGTPSEWQDWLWQRDHVITDPDLLARLVRLPEAQLDNIRRMRAGRLPFGLTPYYASLLDDDPEAGRDRALRFQVLPPAHYVESMLELRHQRQESFDFMREVDTSPVDLVTRRYPAIVIFKPYNTCPQICVYCQRNWEIEEAMAGNALASDADIKQAVRWIAERPFIREVLITGGDPLTLDDGILRHILQQVAAIPQVDLIRIGSRTPVTMPMRITPELAALLGGFREPGRRDICLVTHLEHPYEITDATVTAIDRLRRQGVAVYNQQVFNFFVSRRFESAALRMLMRRIGIDPYYTFMPKGKDETAEYLVPLARILQERKEEARLLPGIRRTDEPVFNVPRLGKNHVRAAQHRDLLAILPNGSRVNEFHPWEKNIVERSPYLAVDIPILDYLARLAAIGEDPDKYSSIWYYF